MFSHLMSDFLKQTGCRCAFAESGAWVVLSEIEQSIKRKIEAVGKPLRDWDVSINYGIKTGFNDAFIVTTQKRDEILASCRTEEEREKTSNIFRPILRGRDIKRYSYEWSELWLIATFPSKHYDIEQYPAIKEYLLSFGMERLEQTGKEYVIDGQHIKARKKTNNKWFETQDSISYWEDLSLPKIIYPDIMRMPRTSEKLAQYPYFIIDKGGMIPEATLFMMTGEDLEQICAFLCSEIGFYAFTRFYMGPVFDATGFRYKKEYLQNLPIPIVTNPDGNYETQLMDILNLTAEEYGFIQMYKNHLLLNNE